MSRILVVEDNPTNHELLRFLLESRGHAVSSAIDGEEGAALIESEHPEIVLCDLRMPRVDGYGLLRRVRANPALDDVVIVAVTAYSMPDDYRRVREAGFDGYLTKPIDPESFAAQVETMLARGRAAT